MVVSMPERIDPVSIIDETKRRYLNYSLSVITARALPDVRDGLKPVQRRILYNMYHDLHLHANERTVKSANVVGMVIARYHPHGDMAVYDALVRMAQPFVLRYPLIFGEGNFGSVDGHDAAAYRYTECRLTAIAEELMNELKQRTADMRPTFDGTTEEPVVLPARFPHLLVNGVSGIAVGMATNIPPHNLGEVLKAAVLLIEEPEASTAQLLDRVKGPDFPLGGRVLADRKTLRKIYEEGSGSIKVQAEWKVEESAKKKQIVVTSIPYGVNKGALEEKIGELIAARQLPQLLNVVNESNEKEGIRIVLEIKPDADPEVVMAYLYKHTAMQENFAYNMTCLVPAGDGKLRPERLGLQAMLRHFLDFRFATVRRRFEYQLEQLRQRIHVLEGFRIIFNDLDKALKLIRDSQGKQDAAEKLMKAFKLDEVQANAILEMLLYRIAQLEIKKILDELREKKQQAEQIEQILRSERKLWGVVRKELEELGETFGDRRRTRIVSEEETLEFDPEAYIVKENTNIVLTRDGWIKRVGRLASVESTRVREGDEVIAVAPGNTHDHVILFSDDGVAFTMRMNEVPASSGYGEPVSKFYRLGEGARIVAVLSTDARFTPADEKPRNGEPPGPYLLIATAQGQTLRMPLTPFRTESNVRGRQYVRLGEGDRVVLVQLIRDEKTVFLASANGHVLHFPIEEINILSGVGKGVIGIKLEEGDTCLGGALCRNQNDALVVETSGGKRMEFHGSREVTGRGGKGFEAVKRSSFARIVPPAITLVNWDEVEGRTPRTNGNGHEGQSELFD
jgi:DNA gyrase subunit A